MVLILFCCEDEEFSLIRAKGTIERRALFEEGFEDSLNMLWTISGAVGDIGYYTYRIFRKNWFEVVNAIRAMGLAAQLCYQPSNVCIYLVEDPMF